MGNEAVLQRQMDETVGKIKQIVVDQNEKLGQMTAAQAKALADLDKRFVELALENSKGVASQSAAINTALLKLNGAKAGRANAAAVGGGQSKATKAFRAQAEDWLSKALPTPDHGKAIAAGVHGALGTLTGRGAFDGTFMEALNGPNLTKSATLGGLDLESLDAFRDIMEAVRIQQVFRKPFEGRQVLEKLNVQSVGNVEQVHYVRELDYAAVFANITTEAAAGQKDVIVGNVNGFYPGQPILMQKTSAPAPGYPNGETVEETGIVASITRGGDGAGITGSNGTITLTANLAYTYPISTPLAPSFIQSVNYNPTALTQVKPSGKARTENVVLAVQTLAQLFQIPRQMILNLPVLTQYLEQRALNAGIRSLIAQVLYGNGAANANGTGKEFLGFFADPEVPNIKWSECLPGEGINAVIRRAALNVRKSNMVADTVMFSPDDWATQELSQVGTLGIWQFLPEGAQNKLWRLDVVESNDIKQGTALVGAFKNPMSHGLWEAEGMGMQLFEQHGYNVALNEITARVEQRSAFGITVPEAFSTATFDSAPVST